MVEFFFRELAKPADQRPPVLTPFHVLRGLKIPQTPKEQQNIRSLKGRLSADATTFFDKGAGRSEKWRIYFEEKDYWPRFRLNKPPSAEVDYLECFWKPHRESKHPTHILYPEPCFFTDGHDTYLRNPAANSIDDRDKFDYLSDRTKNPKAPGFKPYHSQLKTTHSYVPSGTVTAMLTIMKCFRGWGQEITPMPFLPQDSVPPTPNLIVLGTSTSMQAVMTLERSFERPLPIYTGLKHITIDGEEPVEDKEEMVDGICLQLKWGTLTRRWHRSPDRIVTVISGHHGRMVQAIASVLTESLSLSTLADAAKSPTVFPESFQALFSAEMEGTPRGPHINFTAPDRVIDIKKHLIAQQRTPVLRSNTQP